QRIRLFLNDKNSGSYVYSTNLGASKAVAQYIIFAQCDDYAEPSQLSKLYSALESNPTAGVVYSASTMVDQFGTPMGTDYDVRESRFRQQCRHNTLINKEEMTQYFLSSCVIPNLSAALIKRSLFEKQGGLSCNYFVLADWDFWLKTSLECDFYYISEPLNNFRQHNTTIRASIKIKRQVDEVFKMYYDFFSLAKFNFWRSLRWKYHIASVWMGYIGQGKSAWFKSLFPLLKASMHYNFYFPFIAGINFICFPFRYILKCARLKNN
ncbi:MAG: glycosyltransferase, partial [Mucinivorans sp.]